ncbi:MAG: zinc ribbon domain-containing protein [Oscillospiraceae bacterium]|nr:zinc ribbon domain-containing protein [Oscillospiraceae bacterium]
MLYCMQCGEKLPERSKFCYQCGAKVVNAETAEKTPPAPAPAKEPDIPDDLLRTLHPKASAAPQETKEANESASLAQIFASLDPVVCHNEYYYFSNGSPMLNGYSMAVNKKWVLKHVSHFPNDEFLLVSENGDNEIPLDVRPKLRKSEYKNLMGFNTHGVWFFVRSQYNDRFTNVKFICVDVVHGRTYEYPIAHQNGTISDVYVYGDELCYINDTSDFKQYLHRMTPESTAEIFSSQTKAERIFRLSITDKRIAWGYSSSREGKERWFWYLFDKETSQQDYIAAPRHPDRTSQPLIELLGVDLSKRILYTRLSEREAKQYNLPNSSIATRKLADPDEFRILSYAKEKQPAIWRIDETAEHFYFDGSVYYSALDQTELDRCDRFGRKYPLGKTGKGACRNFLVSDKWLYINYDAHDLVRLPKGFSACIGNASENPEAIFIFGKNNNFRI